MPLSTTTKVHRAKRPDSRPNAKTRRKFDQAIERSSEISDLRVTRIPKKAQRDRLDPAKTLEEPRLRKDEKLLRALRKKVRFWKL